MTEAPAGALERPPAQAAPRPLSLERLATLAPWWPLAGLLLVAAALRFSTLGLQSFWFDEAFTPVHVLRPSLESTLHGVVHTENTPPLWYLLAWGWSRIFGTGAIALRSLSALAGVATVALAWQIGRELGTRRTAVMLAALVAVNPLFVWYSQEARAYALFVLAAAVALLLFVRAERQPSARRLAAWGLGCALALLTHYFAVFLIAPMAAWLLWRAWGDPALRAALLAVAGVGLVGLALIPLISAQGGHGTQWIGRWALSSRLDAIPQYYLLGASGASLGHGIELLAALPVLVGAALYTGLASDERRATLLVAGIGAAGLLLPGVLALFGADYLAPRNLAAAWLPLTAALAVLASARRSGRIGVAVAVAACAAGLAVVVAVDVRPRLQRGDWRDVAHALGAARAQRAIVTPELGAAPLEFYLPPLRNLPRRRTASVSEIDMVGYSPLVASAERPPVRGFTLVDRRSYKGLVVIRFRAPAAVPVPEALLRTRAINREHPEVLVPGGPGVP